MSTFVVTDDPQLVAKKWIQTYRNQMCFIKPQDSGMAQAHKKLWKEYKILMANIVKDPTNDTSTFVDGTITYDEVSKSIKKAQNGKSAGPDEIIYEMLNALPKNTLLDMVNIFNFAHTHGVCPEVWHHAIIAPLYKKGDCLNPKNFRPIVLRSAIAKIYEITLLTRVRHVIEWGWNPPPIDEPKK